MSNLLIDDYPILVLPTLASEIGLNEAIVLQQMHYWLKKSNHNYDGRRWIYNTFSEWQKHFPFWSVMTIKRAVYSLEKQNLLYVGNYNKAKFDKTKWYSINYEKLEGMKRPSYQNDTTSVSKRNDGVYQNDTTNTRDYTEITTETTNNNILSPSSTAYPYKDVIDYLNQKTGKHYKSTTKKNQTVIRARTDEGFSLDAFKRVIDNKVAEWKGTNMEKYLRPETLFGTKFEGYLNQELQPSGMDQLERMKYDESYWD
ncbi:conserved phage C-terminal domain-containing protein [Staphylococcus epidermidis]|uniref:conserved phage C-terminal domain-containing protein n=1 Tax=Staphylococcus epidermidis TaxID=1282 RepID=UPI001E341386|nr:conserved phage C-terminal domain-containing protein [Staphylococcus epidermidis]MCD8921989.1 conserved phage C-terminal domain-containing protein [Staphylococcus epidermidis]MCD9056269.1 conserved phage C-terminal domain-containing protein [Staphylococcus epidermidis]MEB5736999.1 conserved phage C-terminal domain-containing protein [Staphylococcus epidermidis]MEB7070150.1 conserved phage C-terminal domain-containing protein [Staphylococcus epidermidis]MEB7387048.1 conserved phage C-termina